MVCNEDEAAHIAGEEKTSPEAGLEFLAGRCPCAVVTLGARGCMVARAGEEGVTFEPALTGAGRFLQYRSEHLDMYTRTYDVFYRQAYCICFP